jgi:hypothetical protein
MRWWREMSKTLVVTMAMKGKRGSRLYTIVPLLFFTKLDDTS